LPLSRGAHVRLLMALLGIPVAGFVALLYGLQLPRLLYGKTDAVFLALECAGLLAWAALVLRLRSRLAGSPEPGGFYRDVLDFFALARWHPAAIFGLIVLLVVPFAWFALANRWMFTMFASLGRRALALGDVQSALEGFAVAYQHGLTAGTPLLFVYHLACRRWLTGRFLPWLLLPLLFAGTAVGVVITVTMAHFAR